MFFLVFKIVTIHSGTGCTSVQLTVHRKHYCVRSNRVGYTYIITNDMRHNMQAIKCKHCNWKHDLLCNTTNTVIMIHLPSVLALCTVSTICTARPLRPGGHKKISSFLADQQRPRIWAQMRGGRGLTLSINWTTVYILWNVFRKCSF
jgi:hypothetical protein